MEKILVCTECLALGGSCAQSGCFCVKHVEVSALLNQELPKAARMSLEEVVDFVARCEQAGCQFGEIARRRVEELKNYFNL